MNSNSWSLRQQVAFGFFLFTVGFGGSGKAQDLVNHYLWNTSHSISSRRSIPNAKTKILKSHKFNDYDLSDVQPLESVSRNEPQQRNESNISQDIMPIPEKVIPGIEGSASQIAGMDNNTPMPSTNRQRPKSGTRIPNAKPPAQTPKLIAFISQQGNVARILTGSDRTQVR